MNSDTKRKIYKQTETVLKWNTNVGLVRSEILVEDVST